MDVIARNRVMSYIIAMKNFIERYGGLYVLIKNSIRWAREINYLSDFRIRCSSCNEV